MSDAPTTPSTTPAPAAAATVEDDVLSTDPAPAAPVDAAEAARLKREARKARILSKGSDRLARITNTGRGEGASAYLNDNAIPSSAAASPAKAAATAVGARAEDDDPLEVDISTLPRGMPRGEEATNPFAMFGGGGAEGGQQDPMAALMAMMQGGGGGPFGGGPGGPPGAGGQQPDMSGLPPQLAAMMQQFGAGAGGPGGANAPSITATQCKPLTERAFDMLQAFLVLALAVLAAKSSLFDTDHSSVVPAALSDTLEKTSLTSSATSTLSRWAKLAYAPPSPSEWSSPLSPSSSSLSFLPSSFSALPLFYIFLTLEITLQALRIAIFSRKTPAPPSMLSTLTMMLPIPNLGLAIKLVSKYLALVNAFVNDVSLLVFVFGVAVLWSGHKLGGVGMLDGAGGVGLGVGHDEL